MLAPGGPAGPPDGEGDEPARDERPHLVLLHGVGDSGRFWDNLLPALRADYRVHAVDLPGHGPAATSLSEEDATPAAMAGVVVRDLAGAGVANPYLVGFSLGGWVALEMAAAGYGRSVVALAPAGLWAVPPMSSPRPGRRLTAAALRALEPVLGLVGRWPALARLAVRGIVADPSKVSVEQLTGAARDRRAAKGADAARRAVFSSRFTGGDRITVPVCVAFGDDDRYVGVGASRAALPPAARWVTVPHCGHAMSWDQPAACLELIAETSALASA
jgi:pimeloyl-ACP methyl ester carboxylesterase